MYHPSAFSPAKSVTHPPRSLRELMQALTDPGQLEREAAKVEEFPVRLHSPPPTTGPSGDPPGE